MNIEEKIARELCKQGIINCYSQLGTEKAIGEVWYERARAVIKAMNRETMFCPVCGQIYEVEKFNPDDNYCDTEDCMGTPHIATPEEIAHGSYS